MNFNIISYTLSLIVMVMIFSTPTIAPWSRAYPPEPPDDDYERSCSMWIVYHGFTWDNYNENREKSENRIFALDKNASTWAAIYAFTIGSVENPVILLPDDFCNSFGEENNHEYPFTALKDETRTCEGWIVLYRFTYNNMRHNIECAQNQDITKIYDISIWPYSYIEHIALWGYTMIHTPSEFCNHLGKKIDENAIPMQFMSVNDTELTCKAWIELYEFTDDNESNYYKVRNQTVRELHYQTQLIHRLARRYAFYLRRTISHGIRLTPSQFCESLDSDDSVTYNLEFSDDI